ncbi:TonB-dependent receptor domain-containing protein [Agaribacterium haliotis]|uniref:TonB-dependent receptor domain-containing protein n=1 Tax=Agaribacterium haliotis TaxID=2013869 RepID=UPI000BB53EB9|nr:TonB-dependent receptor [Agaribacterium haliotis]
MSNISRRFKLSALSTAVLAVNGGFAYAQDGQEGGAALEEELIVTGIRGAMMRSIDDKREAKNIVDTINAEDMGKTTDQNIADSLGRVTGVTVVSRDGEGSQITVRGASSNQNQITLNGQTLTSTDFNQGVDLSSFSSDILSKLEVVKTPSADHDEGSLGASVNLVTARPLDQAEDIYTGTIQGRYSDFSEEFDHKLQFSLSKKFLDDTLGVTATIYDETNTYRKDQFRVERYRETNAEITQATDQNGNIVSGFRAIEPENTGYELHQNTSDRYGINAGIQWAPTDRTELMFNVTYSKQEQKREFDGVKTRSPDANKNFVEDTYYGNSQESNADRAQLAGFSDPQASWYSVDTDTYTLTKKLSRGTVGDITRSVGGDERDNIATTLELTQELTDRFRMSAQVGYSSSKSESLPSAYTNMQNFAQINDLLISEGGADHIPAGYDCTGSRCVVIAGDSVIDYGAQDSGDYDDNGIIRQDWFDNTNVLTGFNPADSKSFHLGSIVENDSDVEDTLSSAQVDFDFDLDMFGLTTTEFGAKFTSREKSVDDQSYEYTSITSTDIIYDEYGNPVSRPAGPLTGIRANIIAGDPLPYDNFMSSLGYKSSNVTKGWTPIDVDKAFDLITDDPELVRTADDTETRSTQLDTGALYLKQNFSYFDDRLTGDVGFRYVRTEVEASGYSGASFHDFSDNTDESEFDLVLMRDLRNSSIGTACRQPNYTIDGDVNSRQAFEQKFNRIDGVGWDTSVGTSYDADTDTWTIDPSQWTRIPAQEGKCYDPDYALYAELVQDDIDDATQDIPIINWVTMWRYADVHTSRNNAWDYSDAANPSNITWDGPGTQISDFTITGQVDRTVQAFPVSNSHSYNNILPSLNLNFAFTDDLVGRFAISKTMTRPELEDTRAGFFVDSGAYWGTGNPQNGSVNMYNTKLEPLESNNLDIGLEWYFNDVSMISAAVFHKDMSNFTERENFLSYVSDVRGVSDDFDASTLLMRVDESDSASGNYGLEGCLPLRATTDFFNWPTDVNRFSNDLRDLCALTSVSNTINGKSAKITGLELGYNQAFDFLPGYFLSGLGVNANYTYQESEYEADVSEATGQELPSLPVAETPEHTYNLTAFWEQDGHQVRLSYRGATDSLVGRDWNTGLDGRTWNRGSLWNEGRDTLDLSATYSVNDYVDVTFQAINLTDAAYRQYYTSRELPVVKSVNSDGAVEYTELNEGSAFDGATDSRTVYEYKVGTTYRLGVRVNF